MQEPFGGAAREDAAGVAASGGADDDQARRLVAGECVQRAWHRGIGDDSRLDSELVAQTGQLRLDGLVVDRVEIGPPAAIGCPRDGGDNHVRAGQLRRGERELDWRVVLEEWVVGGDDRGGHGGLLESADDGDGPGGETGRQAWIEVGAAGGGEVGSRPAALRRRLL